MSEKNSTSVITVRIDEDLDRNIEKTRSKLGMSKADFIRKYLDMSKYLVIQNNAIKSLNNRDFIILKKSTFRKLIEPLNEPKQMELGNKLARFINDIARLEGQIDNIEYKLDLCEHLGLFPKFIDKENYILISKKLGPKKFVEVFTYKLINYDPKHSYEYTDEELKSSKSLRSQYKKEIGPVDRSSSHYSYEFAKIPEIEEE
ncbi:MAG: ribbon-helix-helix protein, CopG family [Candidatus Hermodarchaeota archaeon]